MIEAGVRSACEAVATWAERRPALVLSTLGLLTLIAFGLMGRLSISGSLAHIVGDASPAARALSELGSRFDIGGDLLVLASLPDEPDPSRARERLVAFAGALQQEIDTDPRSVSLVRSVRWRKDQRLGTWIDDVALPAAPLLLDERGFDEFVGRLSETSVRERVRRIEILLAAPGPLSHGASAEAIGDPLDIRGLLIEQLRQRIGTADMSLGDELELSRDRRSLLVRVSAQSSPDDLTASKRLVECVEDCVDRVARADVSATLTGAPAIAAHSASSIRRDLILSVIGAAVGVQVLFLFVYRGPWAFAIVAMPAALGIVWAFGIESILGGRLTALGAAIGAILVGLGVDYAVHVASSIQPSGEGDVGRGGRAVARVGVGVVCAATTTIIAFAVLALSRLEILHGFAGLGAMGLIGAVIATVVLMPILLRARVAPRRFAFLTLSPTRARLGAALGGSACVVIVSVLAILIVVMGPRGFAGLLPLDDSLDSMHPSPSPALAAQRVVDEQFGSSGSGLPVLIEAGDGADLIRAAFYATAALRSRDTHNAGVRGVIGIDALLPNPDEIAARRSRLAEIDIDATVAAMRRVAEESLLAPDALDDAIARLNAMVRSPRPPTLEDLRAHSELARTFLPFDGESNAALSYVLLDRPLDRRSDRAEVVGMLKERLAPVSGATLTGYPVLGEEAERLAVSEVPRLIGGASVGVLMWLAVFFRRPSDVALALLPGLFAFLVLLAALGPLGVRLNIINVAAFPLLIGIGVDDGIFLVAAARDARRHPDSFHALRKRLADISHAVMTTSATTVLAFGSLVLTSTPAIRSLGLAVGIGVAACLWGSLFLLAPLLLLLAARHDRRTLGGTP